MVRRGSAGAGILLGSAGEGRGADGPAAGAGPGAGSQVPPLPGVLAAVALPALRNPPRSREATFIYAAEGCLTQGAFSRGGQRPGEHSSGCTSGRALKKSRGQASVFLLLRVPPRVLQRDPGASSSSSSRVGRTELGRTGGFWGGFWGRQPPSPNDTPGRGREPWDTLATQVGPTRQDIQDIQPRYSGLGSHLVPLLSPRAAGARQRDLGVRLGKSTRVQLGKSTHVRLGKKSTRVRPESSRRPNRGPQSPGH